VREVDDCIRRLEGGKKNGKEVHENTCCEEYDFSGLGNIVNEEEVKF
jgi:hypothetical protein